jgi:hypothetical protein
VSNAAISGTASCIVRDGVVRASSRYGRIMGACAYVSA